MIREEQTGENTARVIVRLVAGGRTGSQVVTAAQEAVAGLGALEASWEVGASALARALGTSGPPIVVEISGQSLEELYQMLGSRQNRSMAALFVAAMREWKRSVEDSAKFLPGVQTRVEKVLDVATSREVDRLERRLLFLATVGATAPFIGLFGTVWGIMTSFQAIAASKNTSLAVVAPGIAEALLATALGLLAAIPAVMFYNKFASQVTRMTMRMEGFADEFAAILSRQIDERSAA